MENQCKTLNFTLVVCVCYVPSATGPCGSVSSVYPQFSLLCSPSNLNTKYLSHPSGETNPIKLSSDAQH